MFGSLLLNFIVIDSKNGCGKKESDAIRVETSKTGTIK
jgi:hypothetical protein